MKTSNLPSLLGLVATLFALPAPSALLAADPVTPAAGVALNVVPKADSTETALAQAKRTQFAQRVRQETRFAWRNYVRYALGFDQLNPVSRAGSNLYTGSLLVTPVDALDTFLLEGLQPEATEALNLIKTSLNFDQDISVSLFEINIRVLGGLLSAYERTGDTQLLSLAQDLGNRFLPAFNTPTGMPYRFVNLRTGAVSDPNSNPAEIGTLILEFGTLSKLTGDNRYYDAAKKALLALYSRTTPIGLVGGGLNVVTGQYTNTTASISGGIDSYYEYLWKGYLLFGGAAQLVAWERSIAGINTYLRDRVRNGELWYGQADAVTGQRTGTFYGALDAFFAGLLALSGDLPSAVQLNASNVKMWNLNRIEPERLDYSTLTVTDPAYILRPEIVESTWYLRYFTGDQTYTQQGENFFNDFVNACKTPTGYTRLNSVITKEKGDQQDSFLFAEVFKYYYLLALPNSALDLNQYVLTTEAHPLRRLGPVTP